MDELEFKKVNMVLKNVSIENDCITIPKEELEKWASSYQDVGKYFMEHGCPTWQSWFYWGKREVLVDLLKHFERYEG